MGWPVGANNVAGFWVPGSLSYNNKEPVGFTKSELSLFPDLGVCLRPWEILVTKSPLNIFPP